MSFDIDGSVALVTGAAGGIGRCISARLAAAGAALALVDIDGDGAGALLAELGAKGVAIAADLTAPAEIAAAVTAAQDRLGPLDILVNNAGISGVGPPKATVDTPSTSGSRRWPSTSRRRSCSAGPSSPAWWPGAGGPSSTSPPWPGRLNPSPAASSDAWPKRRRSPCR